MILDRDQVRGDDGRAGCRHFRRGTLGVLGSRAIVPSVVVMVTMAGGKSAPKDGGSRKGNEAVLHNCE